MNYGNPAAFYLAILDQLPRLYFALVLLFLIPFSCFIVFQLFHLTIVEIEFYQLKSKDIFACTDSEELRLLHIMARKHAWLDAIKLIELRKTVDGISLCQSMNALGFIYYSMRKYDLAKFYYIEALKMKSNYIVAMQNLVKVYEATKQSRLMKLVCQSILKHDSGNKIARRYLAK